MKQTFIRILTVVFTVCAACLKAQTPYNDPNWIHSPVWREEFDGDDINNTYWEVRNYFDHFYYRNIDTIDCSASITDEGQLYRNRKQAIGHNHENRDEQPIFDYDISNGMLRLYLHNENCDCPEYARTKEMCSMQYFNEHCSNTIPQYHYTGACIALKNDHKFKYGYLEARIKMNCGNGFFPAFWLYGVNYGSTHQGADYQEIDIFEMTYGHQSSNITHDQNIMTSNRHYLESPTNPPTLFMINDYTNYHKYGLEWTPSKFIYYVDGCIYRIEKTMVFSIPKQLFLTLQFMRMR